MHEVGLDVKPRLAAAGAANHQHILVPGRLGVFGPPGHGQAFGLGQQDVVFKLGVDANAMLTNLFIFFDFLNNEK